MDTTLTKILRATKLSFEDRIRDLYGLVYVDRDPVLVWIDGSATGRGQQARAGAGVCYGPHALNNSAFRVPGRQTNNAAELYALVMALVCADPERTLQVFADSKYVIRTICHWAIRHAELGWTCANGDLIQACMQLIRRRLAPVIFVWVKGHSGNADNDTADHLAAEGRLLCLPATSPLPQVLDNHQGEIVLPSGPVLSLLKVYTDLPAKMLAHAAHVQEENAEYDGAEVSEDDDEILPYTSQETRTLGMHFLTEVTQARTPAMFWKSIRSLTGGQPRPPQVMAAELHDFFRERMNRQDVLVRDPLAAMRNLDGLFMESVRRPTSDNTVEMFFSRPITEDEIAAVKAKLKEHNMNSAKGADGLAYAELLQVPNEDLRELFQQCIDSCDAPQTWLTTILAAVEKKPSKAHTDANSYRNIGLESCLLKMLTLIIDRRLRDWAAATGRVPMMQNGFRAGHRTMNNVFTLRAVVESTRARAETLWVVLVDLKNAFPSVDQNVLWKKLMDWGVSGPLLDWLRMLYDQMQYVVCYAGELSESFRSFAGILIGDPASPIISSSQTLIPPLIPMMCILMESAYRTWRRRMTSSSWHCLRREYCPRSTPCSAGARGMESRSTC